VPLNIGEHKMNKPKQIKEDIFKISAIWADVMRSGLLRSESDKEDADWWIEHKSEINFAFRVLAGLGLAKSHYLSDDEDIKEEILDELEEREDPNEVCVSPVRPSKTLKRLYRGAARRYRRERDKHLSSSFLRCFTADRTGPA
jgi:hypothetical protein